MERDTVAPKLKVLDAENGLVEIGFHYTSPIGSEIIRQLQNALSAGNWTFSRELVSDAANRICDLQSKRNVCGSVVLICRVNEASIEAIRPCVKTNCSDQNGEKAQAIAEVARVTTNPNAPINR